MSEAEAHPDDAERRALLKWVGLVMLAAGASGGFASAGQAHRRDTSPAGYGRDPNLLEPVQEPWPPILSPRQRAVARAVLDVILPGDNAAPPASAVGLVDFLDQWLSAPYPEQRSDAALLVPWLDDIDRHAPHAGLQADSTSSGEIERLVAAVSQTPAFRRLCVLAAAAYYTSPAGFTDIGFVGNEPRLRFDGPPAEVLAMFERKLAAD